MDMLEQRILDVSAKLFDASWLSFIEDNLTVNGESLTLFDFMVSRKILPVKSILPNRSKEGFVVEDESDVVGTYFTESALIAFLVQKIFSECYRYYEARQQENDLAEFFRHELKQFKASGGT